MQKLDIACGDPGIWHKEFKGFKLDKILLFLINRSLKLSI
jgi:hypothetical protein